METVNFDAIINLCGLAILVGIGLGLVGLRRLGWTLAILGFFLPGSIVMYFQFQPAASYLFDRWWDDQPAFTQWMITLGGWFSVAILATLSLFGVFRIVASVFIGRNAADSLVASLAADTIRGLFRWMFWWRR